MIWVFKVSFIHKSPHKYLHSLPPIDLSDTSIDMTKMFHDKLFNVDKSFTAPKYNPLCGYTAKFSWRNLTFHLQRWYLPILAKVIFNIQECLLCKEIQFRNDILNQRLFNFYISGPKHFLWTPIWMLMGTSKTLMFYVSTGFEVHHLWEHL